jgi:hypothetical protein
VKYFLWQGLGETPLEIELESPPPCLFCGAAVHHPSMAGPLVCASCDMGTNADGSRWTAEQRRVRVAHQSNKIAEYRGHRGKGAS